MVDSKANKFASIVTPTPKPAPLSRPAAAPRAGGTKHIGGHFAPDVLRQFRILASEQETTGQALLEEALDLLFDKYGKPPLVGRQ